MVKIKLWIITLIAWGLLNIGDALTTLIYKYRSPHFNEANPVYIYSGSLTLMLTIKLIVAGVLIWWCVKKYDYRVPTVVRYFVVYSIVLVSILSVFVIVNNSKVLTIPPEQISPIPETERIQIYKEQVGDLKIVEQQVPPTFPLIVPLFVINMIQFLVWRSFEKELYKKEYENCPKSK